MCKSVIQIATVLAVFTVPVRADFVTINQCLNPNEVMDAICTGVALGALQLMEVEDRICAPQGFTYNQMIAMARRDAQKYPDFWNQPWVSAVGVTALHYPCQSNTLKSKR